jgi:hypothetical protein
LTCATAMRTPRTTISSIRPANLCGRSGSGRQLGRSQPLWWTGAGSSRSAVAADTCRSQVQHPRCRSRRGPSAVLSTLSDRHSTHLHHRATHSEACRRRAGPAGRATEINILELGAGTGAAGLCVAVAMQRLRERQGSSSRPDQVQVAQACLPPLAKPGDGDDDGVAAAGGDGGATTTATAAATTTTAQWGRVWLSDGNTAALQALQLNVECNRAKHRHAPSAWWW